MDELNDKALHSGRTPVRSKLRNAQRRARRAATISLLVLPVAGCLTVDVPGDAESPTETSARPTRSSLARQATAPPPSEAAETPESAMPENTVQAPSAPPQPEATQYEAPVAPPDTDVTEDLPTPSDINAPGLLADEEPPQADPDAGPEQFLGAFPQDPAFATFLAENGCYQGIEGHQVCDQIGVEFAFGGSGRATAIFFSPGYAGALPGGVEIGDTPEDVVAKLGEPTEITALSMTWQVNDAVELVVSFPADTDGAFSGTPQPFVVNGVSYHLI